LFMVPGMSALWAGGRAQHLRWPTTALQPENPAANLAPPDRVEKGCSKSVRAIKGADLSCAVRSHIGGIIEAAIDFAPTLYINGRNRERMIGDYTCVDP